MKTVDHETNKYSAEFGIDWSKDMADIGIDHDLQSALTIV